MKIGKVSKLINPYMQENITTILVGPPGVGKTEIAKACAKELGYNFMVTHPVVADPVDYKGIPWVDAGSSTAHFLPFGILRELVDANEPTVVLIDDLGQATQMVQSAIMQLVLERKVDDKHVSSHVRFIACTNRKEDMAGVANIIEPLKTRFVILNVEPSFDDWRDNWAIDFGISPEVIGFFHFRRELFHKFTPSDEIVNHPNPRTIEFLDRVYKTFNKYGIDSSLELEAYAGAVGIGCAQEFLSFLQVRRAVPDINFILQEPDKADIPKDQSVCYALALAITNVVEADTLANAFKYVNRLKKEFQGLFSQELKRVKPELISTPEYVDWAISFNAS